MRGVIGFIILAMIFAYMAHAETAIKCQPVVLPPKTHCYVIEGENIVRKPQRCRIS